jgi:hypothetical protein
MRLEYRVVIQCVQIEKKKIKEHNGRHYSILVYLWLHIQAQFAQNQNGDLSNSSQLGKNI